MPLLALYQLGLSCLCSLWHVIVGPSSGLPAHPGALAPSTGTLPGASCTGVSQTLALFVALFRSVVSRAVALFPALFQPVLSPALLFWQVTFVPRSSALLYSYGKLHSRKPQISKNTNNSLLIKTLTPDNPIDRTA